MRTRLGSPTDFAIDKPTRVTNDGDTSLAIGTSQNRRRGRVVRDRRRHAGHSLSRGRRGGYKDRAIGCPWHTTRVDVCLPEVLHVTPGLAEVTPWPRQLTAMGKSPAPLTVVAASVRDGQIVAEQRKG